MNTPTRHLLSEVLADLAGPDPVRRRLAAEGIRLLGTDVVNRCVGPLLACLEDEYLSVRSAAAWALLGASPLPDGIVPLMMNWLNLRRPRASAPGPTGLRHYPLVHS